MIELVLLMVALIILAAHPGLLVLGILLALGLGFIRFVLRIWTNGFRWGFRTAVVLLILVAFLI